jgi:hypothetical protein
LTDYDLLLANLSDLQQGKAAEVSGRFTALLSTGVGCVF